MDPRGSTYMLIVHLVSDLTSQYNLLPTDLRLVGIYQRIFKYLGEKAKCRLHRKLPN
jgi:hypothetical protein